MPKVKRKARPLWEVSLTVEQKGQDGPRTATRRVRGQKGDDALDGVMDELAAELNIPDPDENPIADDNVYFMSISFRRIG